MESSKEMGKGSQYGVQDTNRIFSGIKEALTEKEVNYLINLQPDEEDYMQYVDKKVDAYIKELDESKISLQEFKDRVLEYTEDSCIDVGDVKYKIMGAISRQIYNEH